MESVPENEKIQKVVFSFDEDLRLLHSLGFFPKKFLIVIKKYWNF